MPFQLGLANESDIREIAKIDEAAMKDNGITQAIGTALAPDDIPRIDFFMSYLRSAFPKDGDSFWKISDTDTGAIVSAAWFSIEDGDDQSPSKIASEDFKESSSESSIQQVHDTDMVITMGKLSGDWKDFAKTNMTSRHCTLHYIATHPQHQRRGAASMLLTKGAVRADEAGLDTFLQASAEGLHVYERFGFVPVRTDRLDLAEFGVDKVEVRTCMGRPAQRP